MSEYHFAAENTGLQSFRALLRGERGYPPLAVVQCDCCDQVIAIAWDDECGWNYLAFTAKGRKMRAAINAAAGSG